MIKCTKTIVGTQVDSLMIERREKDFSIIWRRTDVRVLSNERGNFCIERTSRFYVIRLSNMQI